MTQGVDRRLVAGVELGGTKCVCILAGGVDDVREQVRLATTTPDETLGQARKILKRWASEHVLAGLGLASFGPLDLDGTSPGFGRIVTTPKPGWSGADLNRLAEGFDAPVAIDTDVNGAAFAEQRWGAAQGLDSFAYVTVGTGIGVGTIVRGRSVVGLGHSEAGHLRVGRMAGDDWPGFCPYHGDCAEGLAAGPAIRARTGQPAEDLAPDDPAWTLVVHALAGLFHNLVLTTAPQRILVGGGVPTGQPWLLPPGSNRPDRKPGRLRGQRPDRCRPRVRQRAQTGRPCRAAWSHRSGSGRGQSAVARDFQVGSLQVGFSA